MVALNACSLLVDSDGLSGRAVAPRPASDSDGGTPRLEAGDDSCTSSVLFVSATGNDAADGCSPANAKQTIGAALRRTNESNAFSEIHVCKGTYVESDLILSRSVSLLGGYDCFTWKRTETFGHPTFDGVNATVVTNSNPSGDALRVTGEVTSAIEGFVFAGTQQGDAGSTAVHVSEGAAPKLRHNRLLGGSAGSADGPGSVGLWVDKGCAPEVANNEIRGGTGTGAAQASGSVGVIGEGAFFLHDNVIDGGRGVLASSGAGTGAIGVWLRGEGDYTGPLALARNTITIEGGSCNGTGDARNGLKIEGVVNAEIVENRIDVGQNASCKTKGVLVDSTGTMSLTGNRIYAGSAIDSSVFISFGVHLARGKTRLTDNMIHGGDAKRAGDWVTAVWAANVSDTEIVHNTLQCGRTDSSFCNAMLIGADSKGTIVENNILVGKVGVFLDACESDGLLRSFRNNLAVGATYLVRYGGGGSVKAPCTAWSTYDKVAESQDALSGQCGSGTVGACTSFGGLQASGNMMLKTTACNGEPGCLNAANCTTLETCAATLFDAWDASSSGRTDLFGAGWKLSSAAPCVAARSGLDLTGQVQRDLFGAERTKPPSVGAHEYDGACQ
jgi:hypothetical protein